MVWSSLNPEAGIDTRLDLIKKLVYIMCCCGDRKSVV